MQTSRSSRVRRVVARTLVVCVVAALVFGIWAWPRAGRYLIIDGALQPADAVVVLAGRRVERTLEGVELYREKVAPRILLSSGRIEPAEQALRERGVRFPREVDVVRDVMLQLGVPASTIETFPDSVDNTAAEAMITRDIVMKRGWRRLIVVTSKYHTRRARYAFERAFRGSGVQIQVRGTRFDTARPNEWWKHRADIRFVMSEYQKLLAYRLGLQG